MNDIGQVINRKKVNVYYLLFYKRIFFIYNNLIIYFTVQLRDLKIKIRKLIKIEVPSNGII